MEPLQGSHEKPNPLSQGGASLTLGFDREPRCGSLVFCYPIAYKEPRCGSYGCFSISGETGSNDADTYEIKLL